MNIDLLRRLCETPGIPGREERVRELILEETEGLFDERYVDSLGNLICRRDPRVKATRAKATKKKTARSRSAAASASAASVGAGSSADGRPTRVMMASHMDEIGFYVSSIDDNGFLVLNPAGGFDTRNLFSRRVLVCTEKKDYVAVMNPGGRPIHIAYPEDRKKVPTVKEFRVDMGMSAKDVSKVVQIGDMVVMHEPFLEIGQKVVSKALDNRFACWLGIESVRALDKAKTAHAAEIVVAFTVQEEVGLRGAKVAANAVQPDIGIGLDVTLACDTPDVPESEAVTIQGKGVGLHVMDSSFISDHTLVKDMEAVAKARKIPYQRTILPAGGQDGAALQQAMAGARAAGLVVGTRYIHTVTEMIDKRDLAASLDLLCAFLPTVK